MRAGIIAEWGAQATTLLQRASYPADMRHLTWFLIIPLLLPSLSAAQDQTSSCDFNRPQHCAVDVLHDQAGIWTSPTHIKGHDLVWIVPFVAATGIAIHFDTRAMRQLGSDPGTISTAKSISNWGAIYVPLGTVGLGYLVGVEKHDNHLRRTAMLAGEAIADALILDEGLKYLTNRERPDMGDGKGEFWAHGFSGYQNGRSFPSGHSIMAWSFAHVIADEYPHWWTSLAVYGMATSVSVTRVVGRQHWPSDVIVGSTFGYLVGGYVYRHHDPQARHAFEITPAMGPGPAGVTLSIR